MDYQKLPLRQPQGDHPRWEHLGLVDLHSPLLEGGLIEHGREGVPPPLKVKDSPTEVLLRMHCPGVPRESLEVGVENGKLYLAGEGFRRCLSLPDDIDSSRVEAFHGEGVLEIHLRKV